MSTVAEAKVPSWFDIVDDGADESSEVPVKRLISGFFFFRGPRPIPSALVPVDALDEPDGGPISLRTAAENHENFMGQPVRIPRISDYALLHSPSFEDQGVIVVSDETGIEYQLLLPHDKYQKLHAPFRERMHSALFVVGLLLDRPKMSLETFLRRVQNIDAQRHVSFDSIVKHRRYILLQVSSLILASVTQPVPAFLSLPVKRMLAEWRKFQRGKGKKPAAAAAAAAMDEGSTKAGGKRRRSRSSSRVVRVDDSDQDTDVSLRDLDGVRPAGPSSSSSSSNNDIDGGGDDDDDDDDVIMADGPSQVFASASRGFIAGAAGGSSSASARAARISDNGDADDDGSGPSASERVVAPKAKRRRLSRPSIERVLSSSPGTGETAPIRVRRKLATEWARLANESDGDSTVISDDDDRNVLDRVDLVAAQVASHPSVEAVSSSSDVRAAAAPSSPSTTSTRKAARPSPMPAPSQPRPAARRSSPVSVPVPRAASPPPAALQSTDRPVTPRRQAETSSVLPTPPPPQAPTPGAAVRVASTGSDTESDAENDATRSLVRLSAAMHPSAPSVDGVVDLTDPNAETDLVYVECSRMADFRTGLHLLQMAREPLSSLEDVAKWMKQQRRNQFFLFLAKLHGDVVAALTIRVINSLTSSSIVMEDVAVHPSFETPWLWAKVLAVPQQIATSNGIGLAKVTVVTDRQVEALRRLGYIHGPTLMIHASNT